jgi:hypothetical protein
MLKLLVNNISQGYWGRGWWREDEKYLRDPETFFAKFRTLQVVVKRPCSFVSGMQQPSALALADSM